MRQRVGIEEGEGMEPTWTSDCGTVRLWLADALDVLPALEKASIVITDPPFGVRDEDWDSMDACEFARFSMAWLSQARRISGSLVSFYASGTPFKEWCEYLYPRVRQLIWNKPIGSQYAGSSEEGMWFAYEPIAHCYTKQRWEVVQAKDMSVATAIKQAREAKGLSRGGVDMVIRGKKTGLCYRWEEAACLPTPEQAAKLTTLLNLNGEFHKLLAAANEAKEETLQKMSEKSSEDAARMCDVFTHRTVTNGVHPCEKPVELLTDIVETATDAGDVVLDPFMGSGTCGVSCVRLERSYWGIEKEPKYFEIAKARISDELIKKTGNYKANPNKYPLLALEGDA